MKNKIGTPLNVLFLEDTPQDAEICRELIIGSGYNLDMDITATEKEFESFLRTRTYDIILSDFKLPGFDGFGALRLCNKICPGVPFICVSGFIGEETAIELLKLGAVDYILKDRPDKLPLAIKRALNDAKEKETRQKVEKLLADSEVRYRRLFETAKDGILILDSETGKIIDVNPFLVELLGYSKEQFIEKEIWEIGFFKDIAANEDIFLELQQKEYVRYENLPLETADGRKINVEFVINVYLVGHRKLIQCNIRDITKRKEIEDSLEKTRKELAVIKISADEASEFAENIINTVREPLLLLDKELRVVKANRSFYDIFNVSSDDTIGTLIYDLGNQQWNIPKLRELLETILPEKTTFDNYEVEHNFSTIGKHMMLLNARQIKGALRKKKIILLAIEDITARKLTEEALRVSHLKYRTLFESFPLGITVTDRTGKILEVNLKAEKFLDLLIEEQNKRKISGEEWRINRLDGTPMPTEEYASVRAIKENRLVENVEMGVVLAADDITWISVTAVPLLLEELGLVITYSDITERKRLEAIVEQTNEKLVKLNAEKDKFFSIIAHDLKSPFSGFLNLTGLMADVTEEFSPAELVEHSKSMNETAHNLYKLLENLLEWAQIQKGSINFTPKDSDLSKIVSQSIDTIYQRALQKGITIINEIGNTQKVYADEKMISTVLRNLLSNAVKFTGMDGKVIVKSKPSDNGTIEVSVEDNGVGIPENDVEKLFKIEEKVSTKGTDGESSTGLGLLLCKEFIEMHSGKIWVESEAGKGSKFKFTLSKSILSSA